MSDLHIGKRLNGVSLLDDQRHILRQILRIAEERQVKALLIAGDIYDKASPSAEAVTVFDAFLTDAVAARLRVLAIPGNMIRRSVSHMRRVCWKARACVSRRCMRVRSSALFWKTNGAMWRFGCCRF